MYIEYQIYEMEFVQTKLVRTVLAGVRRLSLIFDAGQGFFLALFRLHKNSVKRGWAFKLIVIIIITMHLR